MKAATERFALPEIGRRAVPASPIAILAPKQAIVEFVQATTRDASETFVPPGECIATFDQDGTFTQQLCDEAMKNGWVVVSMKKDWKHIFAD